MKAYQDKTTGLWKWSAKGKAIYKTKQEAQNVGLRILTDRLIAIRDRLNKHLQVHGR